METKLLALWRDVERIQQEEPEALDEAKFLQTYQELTSVLETALPELLRPDFVRDACALLHHERNKTLLEKIAFLTTREVYENEIFCALRILCKSDLELSQLPASLEEIKRACRHIRIDLVESAMQFFQSKVVAKKSFADKVSFLWRTQELSPQEIEEALDKMEAGEVLPQPPQPSVVEQRAAATSSSNAAAPPATVSSSNAVAPPATSNSSSNAAAPPATSNSSSTANAAASAASSVVKPDATATPAPVPETRSKLQQAVQFLQGVTNMEQGAQFLQNQRGYTQGEAEEAVSVKRVCDFLLQPGPAPVTARVRFLLSKGITQQHIDHALKLTGKSANANVQRAIDFLSNPQTSALPQADKVAFLKKQGLSAQEIDEAVAMTSGKTTRVSGIKMNATMSTAPAAPVAEFAPSLLTMCQTLLLHFPVKFAQERAAFLAVLLFHERHVLLRTTQSRTTPSLPNRGWDVQLREFLQNGWEADFVEMVTNAPKAFDWIKRVARLAATHTEYLALLFQTLRDDNTVVGQIELDFTLTRALHLHYVCQLSVLRLESVPSSSLLLAAALLRGTTDFGSGLAPKTLQADLKAVLQLDETNGVAQVYAGENWISLPVCWPGICALVFDACIPPVFEERFAQAVVKSTAFRLTSTIAGMLTKLGTTAGAGEEAKKLNLMLLRLGEDLFASVLGETFVTDKVAKYMVTNVTEDADLPVACIRVYQTVYLVFIVLIESCVDLEHFLFQWNLISHFAFARVHSEEAIRLVELFDKLVLDDKLALNELAHIVAERIEATTASSAENFVLGAKLDYLMQTGARFFKWDTDLESTPFAKLLLFGCKHDYDLLAQDCNVLITESVRKVAVNAEGEEAAIPLPLALVPQYFENLASTTRLDGQVLGFSIGSVFTSLGSTSNEHAPALACLAYNKLVGVDRHSALCFMALKAVALPSLSMCLDSVGSWLRQRSFRAMVKDNQTESRLLKESLYGVISRIEDAPRRGILMLWFLEHVNAWEAMPNAKL